MLRHLYQPSARKGSKAWVQALFECIECYSLKPSETVAAGGRLATGVQSFQGFLASRVKPRILDSVGFAEMENELAALATTSMSTETLRKILSSDIDPLDWEIGEGIAECFAEDVHGITWPWNSSRDKKTPRASLPGADLVGFVRVESSHWLVFGEVKTSSDANSPPGVMNGRGGMIHQLDLLATSPDIHRSLLTWLFWRSRDQSSVPFFREAVRNYLESQGKKIFLIGVLLRDTQPNEKDLRSRVEALSASIASPMTVTLYAIYTPIPIAHWVATIKAA